MSWNISHLDIRNFLEENKNKIEIELSKSVGRQSRAGLCQVVVALLVRRSSIPRSQSCPGCFNCEKQTIIQYLEDNIHWWSGGVLVVVV